MKQFIIDIINHPIISLSIIINIFFIESILSMDNVVILASMINEIEEKYRPKAMQYGIFGAYFFRSLAIFFSSILIHIWWLKLLGGIYLIYISCFFFLKDKKYLKFNNNKYIYNSFWKMILSIEIIDLSFSIDNLFAIIAFSKNFFLILLGTFMGIFTMRYFAKIFAKIIKKNVFIKQFAFVIIFLLGIKLILETYDLWPFSSILTESLLSLITITCFILSILISFIKNKTNTKLK
ncbi:TerC family protein [Blattabacterium cuenoti]|uniref:TerC family protein n=1 Tax=Blattabacterium cuenoti TaxID=1653831 RepID=UPI00163CA101|nr:DUF475 domain-containing protein [Blattabacterium cuenoti]